MDAQSTVSSITGDQPLQRPPHGMDRPHPPPGGEGIGGSPDLDSFGGLAVGSADGILDTDLLDPGNLGSSSSTSTTTTLRPPPWLKTNVTKNSTTSTTTTSTTSTTTTTTPQPSTPRGTEFSSSDSSAGTSEESEASFRTRGEVQESVAKIPVSQHGPRDNMNPGSEIIEDEAQEREDMFEEQDRILEKEMDHSFSQNYPHSPEPHDRQEANIPAPGK